MIRVVQWTTGRVAGHAIRAVQAHPELELVGGFAWSAEKAGRDVGELIGLPPLGIAATSDIDEIIALRPDVVLYMPLLWDVDAMVKLLESGINVISTANFITGSSYGADQARRLREAAERGGVSLYGTGINPGQASAIALTAAAASSEIQRISIHEAADCTQYESEETWSALGFGKSPDTPGIEVMAKERQAVFGDAVEMMALALKLELDEIRFTPEFGIATKDLGLSWMDIAKDTICGMRGVWEGIVGGRTLLEITLTWRIGQSMTPDWPIEEGHLIEVVGKPTFRIRHDMIRSPDGSDYGSETAHPAVNAVPAVVAARPGLVTLADLPLITGASFV